MYIRINICTKGKAAPPNGWHNQKILSSCIVMNNIRKCLTH